MSVDNSTSSDETNSDRDCTLLNKTDGRAYIIGPDDELVNLARLTAYAEHGEKIHDTQAHHEITLLKIDAPAYIDALSPEEHGRIHGKDSEPVEVDGIPLVRAEG